jgi:hypothetical protein
MNNLLNFPTVYCPSIGGEPERSMFMINQAKKYNININLFPVKPLIFHREEFIVHGKYAGSNKQKDFHKDANIWSHYATFISYLQCMRHWFDNTNEEMVLICDDDMDFCSAEHWNFSWEHFLSLLPKNWQCIQLIRMRGDIDIKLSNLSTEQIVQKHLEVLEDLNAGLITKQTINYKIVPRNMFHCNTGGSVFLLRREYVDRLLKKYIKDNEYFIDVVVSNKYRNLVDDPIMFLANELYILSLAEDGESFNFPIITENQEFFTTFCFPRRQSKPEKMDPITEYVKYNSREFYDTFWKHVCKYTSIENMMYNPIMMGYDIVAPNKMHTKFSESLLREMRSNR